MKFFNLFQKEKAESVKNCPSPNTDSLPQHTHTHRGIGEGDVLRAEALPIQIKTIFFKAHELFQKLSFFVFKFDNVWKKKSTYYKY